MKRIVLWVLLSGLLHACNSSADTRPDTDKTDSGVEVTLGLDTMEEADTRGLEPGETKQKSDTMKENLKVSFPDKKK